MSELSQLKAQLAHCDNTIGNLRHDLKYMTVDRDALQVRVEAAEGLADGVDWFLNLYRKFGTAEWRNAAHAAGQALTAYRKASE